MLDQKDSRTGSQMPYSVDSSDLDQRIDLSSTEQLVADQQLFDLEICKREVVLLIGPKDLPFSFPTDTLQSRGC